MEIRIWIGIKTMPSHNTAIYNTGKPLVGTLYVVRKFISGHLSFLSETSGT
jgi:hypothetical protein